MRWLRRLYRAGAVVLGLLGLAVIIAFLLPVSVTVTPLQPRADTRYWHMEGGYRIAYTLLTPPLGVAERVPVIFLHGGPGGYVHSSIIRALQPLADAGHRVYLYDQHGSGLSDRLDRPKGSRFNDQVDDLEEIVTQQLGASHVALIGHSHGARIAVHFAATHPAQVEALVLSSPGNLEPSLNDPNGHATVEATYPVPTALHFQPPEDEQYRQDTALSAMPLKVILAQAAAMAFDLKLLPDAEVDAALNTLAAGFTRNMVCDPANVQAEEGGAGFYVRTGANWFADVEDPRPRMRQFTSPVLVLQGQCDFVPYAEAYEYAALFPNARYRFIERAGHLIWWEQASSYAAAIVEFLATPEPEMGWTPPAGKRQQLLWPEGAPDMPAGPPREESVFQVNKVPGREYTGIAEVSAPTITVFPAQGEPKGVAIIVFPGGGFRILAIDIEGTEICDWISSRGIACVLLKYRVPGSNHHWDSDCRCHITPPVPLALRDAQRAIRMVRAQAESLGVAPDRIGVIGFSAGGYLVAQVSTVRESAYLPKDRIDQESNRPDFAIAMYPGHLCRAGGVLDPSLPVGPHVPPTFLLQAWDDPVDDICNSTLYARALDAAGVSAEVHLFASGGHAFGLRPTGQPISDWPKLVERWLQTTALGSHAHAASASAPTPAQ
jgi:proline iminopeptidase